MLLKGYGKLVCRNCIGKLLGAIEQILLLQMSFILPLRPDPFIKIKRFLPVWKSLTCRKKVNRRPEVLAIILPNFGSVSNERKMNTQNTAVNQRSQ